MTANVRDNTRDTNIEIYIFHSRQNILIIRMYMKADEKNKEKKDNYNRLAKNKIRNKHTHSHIYTA